MSVYYDHYDSPLGSLALAATDSGLCVIAFMGEKEIVAFDQAALEGALIGHLPAELRPAPMLGPTSVTPFAHSPDRLEPVRHWLDRYFQGQPVDADAMDMPLDLRGTPFQLKVWNQLARIPYGHTESYGEIAKRLRQPGAARAVGLANNRNPIPILIPCHRVVGADGKLVGYGGGLWRKKALLRLEEGDLFATL